jgi:hypothetical protein
MNCIKRVFFGDKDYNWKKEFQWTNQCLTWLADRYTKGEGKSGGWIEWKHDYKNPGKWILTNYRYDTDRNSNLNRTNAKVPGIEDSEVKKMLGLTVEDALIQVRMKKMSGFVHLHGIYKRDCVYHFHSEFRVFDDTDALFMKLTFS